jgi:hypothetical protein
MSIILAMNLLTTLIRRSFTEALCKFHNHRRLDRQKYSVGSSHTPTEYSIGIFQVGIFFWRAISVYKTIDNFFFTNEFSNRIRHYRRKES